MRDKNNIVGDIPTIFRYFDDDFYRFLTVSSKGNTNRKIQFKNKKIKILTPNDAFLIKYYIDNCGLKYKTSHIKKLLLSSDIIQNILNEIRNIKKYK